MPIYEYQCQGCNHELEKLQKLSDEPASPARFFLLPLLKSVSYQPPPFSRKPAALILRFSCGSPHCGQTDSGSSEIFCSFSSS